MIYDEDKKAFLAQSALLHGKIAAFLANPEWGASTKYKYLALARALVHVEEKLEAV